MTEPTMTLVDHARYLARCLENITYYAKCALDQFQDRRGHLDIGLFASLVPEGEEALNNFHAFMGAPHPAPETGALDTMTADEWKAITRGWELQCREAEAAARIRDEALEEAAKRAETMNAATCGPREIGKAIRALKSAAGDAGDEQAKEKP